MPPLRVACLQLPHGDDLDALLDGARAAIEEARRAGAALALLPEYAFATGPPSVVAEASPRVRAFFEAESRKGIALAGNVVEGVRNVGVVYERGAAVLEQGKIHPMPREVASGIVGGGALTAGVVVGLRTGLLVCADILFPEAAQVLALQRVDLLLNPVMSPYRAEDPGKAAREAVYIARAYDAGAFVLKAGGFRVPVAADPVGSGGSGAPSPASGPPAVAGRSLVAAPWGLVARYEDDFAREVLLADLDLERLRRFREGQGGFPPRHPAAYRPLVDGGDRAGS